MKDLICIVCPIGCRLQVTEGSPLQVSGNRCPRGAAYAEEEILSPKRVLTATCKLVSTSETGGLRRMPVKTSKACPRELIDELLQDIYSLKVSPPIQVGESLIQNWKDSGIDVVAVRTVQ